MIVVEVNSYTTQARLYEAEDIITAKKKLEELYCEAIKKCISSYIDPDSSYAFIKTELGDIEYMLGTEMK